MIPVTKLLSNISPAASVSEWSSESSRASLDTISLKSGSVDFDAPLILDLQNHGKDLSAVGHETQATGLLCRSVVNAPMERNGAPPPTSKPSGLRLPSPKIGFFDGLKSAGSTPNGSKQPHPLVPSSSRKYGTRTVSLSGGQSKGKLGKLQPARTVMKEGSKKPDTQQTASNMKPTSSVPVQHSLNAAKKILTPSRKSISPKVDSKVHPKSGTENQLKDEKKGTEEHGIDIKEQQNGFAEKKTVTAISEDQVNPGLKGSPVKAAKVTPINGESTSLCESISTSDADVIISSEEVDKVAALEPHSVKHYSDSLNVFKERKESQTEEQVHDLSRQVGALDISTEAPANACWVSNRQCTIDSPTVQPNRFITPGSSFLQLFKHILLFVSTVDSLEQQSMAEFLTFGARELLKKVASLADQEFSLVWGFNEELTKLRGSLNMLEAVLRDAEHPRQDQGHAVKLWLEKLEDIAHLADDVLDDYGFELLRRKVELQNQMKKKVLSFLSLSNPFVFRVKMAHKIKKINTSLGELKKDASTIGLVANKSSLESTISHDRRIDRETYSDFKKDENNIIGRKDVVEDVVKALTNSNNNHGNDFSVMAILGMGGLGKTTLAKSVYHHDKIQQHFQKKMWVCVSTSFEVNLILRGILESLKPEHAAVQARDAICRILKKELKEKRYLLVLDDVWNEDAHKWEELIGCLENVNDTQGSSILVTTRRDTVAKLVETFPRRDLEKLSDDECWLILKDRAIPIGSAPLVEDQEKIGREIAKKCGGVPLVAKVLGNMMRSKKFDGWQSISENVICGLPDGENRIMEILKLSFDELRSPWLKQCFAYCSAFPKDFEFEKDDLIQHWMAQGWLDTFPNQNDLEMEDTGNEYFNILLQNSFFQDVERDSFGNTTTCKMHDLVHDLAIRASKSKYFRSLFFNGVVLKSNSHGFKALRVLNLYKADIHELPGSIGKLKHLRYLNVMKTMIKSFPKSLGRLYNLQTFKMPDYVEEFPKQIANLISLRHIYFGKFVEFPAGVLGRLTNLRSLPFVKIGKERGPQIGELGGVNHLKDTLSIYNLEHVRDKEEAENANLVEKKHVRKLVLRWGLSRPSNSAESDEVVLEVLRPHSNLEFLEIKGFMDYDQEIQEDLYKSPRKPPGHGSRWIVSRSRARRR
ncbi:hypothetical protein ACLB2K_056549 [Fragaria x ananassa]